MSTRIPGGYYSGWNQVGASMLGTGLSFPVIAILCFSTFIHPLEEEFGWTRGQISIALALTTFAQVLINPLLGKLLDRYGTKRLLIPSTILLSLVVASGYLLTDNIWHLYLVYLLIPVLGAGTGTMIWSRLLVNWFDRRRGMALGIGLSGVGLGAALMNPVLRSVIDSYGWREAYLLFALVGFVLALPNALFVVKGSPSEAGLENDPREKISNVNHSGALHKDLTLKETYKTRQYKLLMAAFLIFGVTLGGTIGHLFPMIKEHGLSGAQTAAAMSAMGLAIIFGRVICGFLLDRLYAPFVAGIFLCMPILGLLMFATGVNSQTAILAAVLFGLGVGAEFDVVAFMIGKYFGLKNYGTHYGHIYAIFQFGHCLGPIALGFAHDTNGNYSLVLWIFIGLTAIGTLLVSALGEYRTPLTEPIATS